MGGVARWFRRRPDGGLGLRLALACLAVFLVAAPFTVLLALVDARWVPLRHLDDDASLDTHSFVVRHPALEGPLRATAVITHPWVFRVFVLLLAVWAAVRGRWRLAVWALVTMAVAGVVVTWVKAWVARPRPVLSEPIAHAPGASFPSGHALGAAVGCSVIVVLLLPVLRGGRRMVAWTIAAVVAVATGAFRVLLGVHYVSDVVAGWILGGAIVLGTAAAFTVWRRGEGRRRSVGRCRPRPR
jgi:membrane-associated phospholipid phosphatase